MKAYELLSGPEKWTKGRLAADRDGDSCGPLSDRATCWCISGALIRCYGKQCSAVMSVNAALRNRRMMKDTDVVPDWNDAPERTYEEVVGLLRELDI
jgi:hypothetical protein